MLEIPESTTIARQLNKTVFGKTICNIIANSSPHKFAFYHGDPAYYIKLLSGQVIGESVAIGEMVEISAGDRRIEKPSPLNDSFDMVYFYYLTNKRVR